MRSNTKLKENLQDFIEERLNESKSMVVKNKDYKKIEDKKITLLNTIKEKLQDEKLIEEYRNIEFDVYQIQLQQAYLTGLIDSTIINNNSL